MTVVLWRKKLTEEDFALVEAHRTQREELKRLVIDEVDGLCECCDAKIGYDLHEVFVKRSDLPKARHREIFVRSNCALLCRGCHERRADTDEFKQRFKKRLEILGHMERTKNDDDSIRI